MPRPRPAAYTKRGLHAGDSSLSPSASASSFGGSPSLPKLPFFATGMATGELRPETDRMAVPEVARSRPSTVASSRAPPTKQLASPDKATGTPFEQDPLERSFQLHRRVHGVTSYAPAYTTTAESYPRHDTVDYDKVGRTTDHLV